MWHEQSLLFGVDHPTATGHFPGRPVIPGALLLDAALAAIAPAAPSLTLTSAKFLRMTPHGTTLRLRWRQRAPGRWQFECHDGPHLVMTGTLTPQDTPGDTP